MGGATPVNGVRVEGLPVNGSPASRQQSEPPPRLSARRSPSLPQDPSHVPATGAPGGPDPALGSGDSAEQQLIQLVEVLQDRVTDRLTHTASGPQSSSGSNGRSGGLAIQEAIQDVLDEYARKAVHMGVAPLPAAAEDEVHRRLLARFAGLGGLQPLLEDPNVETININGCDRVFLQLRDGSRVRAGAVAASDAELIALLRALGSRPTAGLTRSPTALDAQDSGLGSGLVGGHERRFDHGNPELSLGLPGGARLHALMDVSDRVAVSIRCHPPARITLLDLVRAGELDEGLAQLLAAMVRGRRNIVVSGGPAAGKTTLLRGLAAEIPPAERLIVVEDVSELRLPEADHPDLVALQVREANLEGHGEIGARQLVRSSLRMSPDRVIVGEVRGAEVEQMARAMSIGIDGSMATVHASSSQQALMRLVAYAMEPGAGFTYPAATALIAGAVHVVVHLERLPGGRRVVASVREVLPDHTAGDGDGGGFVGVASNEIYRPGPDGAAIPATPPRCLDLLARNGFDPGWLQYRAPDSRERDW